MSGQAIFKKLLVEKENAAVRRQLINGCIGLATTFTISAMAYSSLTYLAAQPALSRGPRDATCTNNSVAGNANAGSGSVGFGSGSATAGLGSVDFGEGGATAGLGSVDFGEGGATAGSENVDVGAGMVRISQANKSSPEGLNISQAGQSSFAAGAGNAGKSGSSATSLSEPESGVKLLLSIFTRLWNGSGSQIAMLQDNENRWAYKPNAWGGKAKAPRETEIASAADQFGQQQRAQPESQLSQAMNSNVSDPALSIRPQVSKRAAFDDGLQSQSREKLIASAPPSMQKQAAQSQMAMQRQAAPAQMAAQDKAGPASVTQPAPAAQPQLSDRAQAANRNLGGANWYKSSVPIKIVSESPDIREFGQEGKRDQDARREQVVDTRAKLLGKRQVNIVDEPLGRARVDHANLIEQSKDLAGISGNSYSNSNSDSVTGIIRPSEQPGLFKYVREYYKENLKAMPPPAAASAGASLSTAQVLEGAPVETDAKSSEESEKAKNEPATKAASTPPAGGIAAKYGGGGGGALNGTLLRNTGASNVAASFDVDKEMGRGYSISNFRANKKKHASPLQIAFLPPNAVHGIAGLSLGATTSETTAFLKAHGNGKFTKVAISGFQIFTLKGDRGITA